MTAYVPKYSHEIRKKAYSIEKKSRLRAKSDLFQTLIVIMSARMKSTTEHPSSV